MEICAKIPLREVKSPRQAVTFQTSHDNVQSSLRIHAVKAKRHVYIKVVPYRRNYE